jgi:uncharacterized membrane protein YfcA
MMVHGAVQATANGSRSWFLREHIQWRIMPLYGSGAATALAAFTALTLVPDAGVVLILVGVFPFLARINRRLSGLDITRPVTTFSCGVSVTAAQLLAGASGPLLDVFYLNTSLNRHQVIASKAITQTLGHILKLIYYGLIVGVSDGIPWWLYPIYMATAVAGTRIGTKLLDRWNDEHFRLVGGRVILTIAAICIVKGVVDLGWPL